MTDQPPPTSPASCCSSSGLTAASLVRDRDRSRRGSGSTSRAASQLVYQGKPTAQSKVNAESLNRAIDIMRKRVDQLGVAQPEIQTSGRQRDRRSRCRTSSNVRARRSPGRHDRAAVLLRLGAERDRPRTGRRRATEAHASPAMHRPRRRRRRGGPARVPGGRCAPPNARAILRKNRHDLVRPAARPRRPTNASTARWYLLDTDAARRSCAAAGAGLRADGNRRQTCTPRLQTAARARSSRPVRVKPGTVLLQARPDETASGKVANDSPNSCTTCSTTNGADRRQTSPTRSRAPTKARRHGSRTSTSASPRTAKNVVPKGDQGNRRARPGSAAAGRQQGSCAAALRGRARRPADHRRRRSTSRSTRTGSTRRAARRSPAASRSAPRRTSRDELQSRRAADQAGADLALAGLGDARQTGPQPGPRRRPRRASLIVCLFLLVFYRVLGADRGRRPDRSTASTSSR